MLRPIASDMANLQIAEELVISLSTVLRHVSKMPYDYATYPWLQVTAQAILIPAFAPLCLGVGARADERGAWLFMAALHPARRPQRS